MAPATWLPATAGGLTRLHSPDPRGLPCSQEVQCAPACPEGEEGSRNTSGPDLGTRALMSGVRGARSGHTGHPLWDICVNGCQGGTSTEVGGHPWGVAGSVGVCGVSSMCVHVCMHA